MVTQLARGTAGGPSQATCLQSPRSTPPPSGNPSETAMACHP